MPKKDGAAGLAAEWAPFAEFIDRCNLLNADGSVALGIVTVSATRYYADRPDGTETATFPQPIMLGPDQREVGWLPYSYPDDPPFAIVLSFPGWSKGLPQQIDIFVHDPTVSGDHALTPMRWSAAEGRYSGGTEQ